MTYRKANLCVAGGEQDSKLKFEKQTISKRRYLKNLLTTVKIKCLSIFTKKHDENYTFNFFYYYPDIFLLFQQICGY